MRHLVTLVSGEGWHVRDLRRAAERQGVRLDAVPFPTIQGWLGQGGGSDSSRPRIVAGGIDLLGADAVLVRRVPPAGLEPIVFRMDALHRLRAAGVPVLNPPAAIEAAVDKYLALAKLEAAGLPVPPTWVGESAQDALAAFEALGGEVVLKPLFGSEGRGLLRLNDPELAWRACQAVERLGSVLYLQKFEPGPGHDLRAFVVGDRVLGAIERTPRPGDWRANLAQGGQARAVALDAATCDLAVRAAHAVGARIAGVDLLPTTDGRRLVVEVNAVPGWRGLQAATGLDVAAAILDELRSACRERRPGP